METLRWLSYDVAGFTLAYAALFVYAVVYARSRRWLSSTIIVSSALFLANVPFLWLASNMAVILMALSIVAFAAVQLFLAREAAA